MEEENEDVKQLKPLVIIKQMEYDVVDIQWILNDTFLMFLTSDN